jgi:hypothetical protein
LEAISRRAVRPPVRQNREPVHSRLELRERAGASMIAPAPPLVDNTGESDFEYFTARPHARHRIRSPFPRELPPEFLTHRDGGTAVITVVMERDARGRPTRRGRGICFIDDGGRA